MKTKFSLLLSAALALLSITPAHGQGNIVQSLSSVTVMLTLPSQLTGYTFFCEGLTSSGDGSPAAGFYRYYPSSTDSTNTWGVFAPPFGGRWKRLSGLVNNVTYASATGSTSQSTRSGRVEFAIGGSTNLVVTNSLVSTGSVVLATMQAFDATATTVSATPAAGSFTLTINGTNTAQLPVAWFLLNP